MAKLGAVPSVKFIRDGDRYIVFLGDDRIGFTIRTGPKAWEAVDTFMDNAVNASSRGAAGNWLKREFLRAVREGKL